MAKLGKEKFSVNGIHTQGRTTSHGQVELFLYYDTTKYYFYFEREEMKKYFLYADNDLQSSSSLFSQCDTRDKAIGVVIAMLSKDSVEERWLRIELGMPSELYKIANPKYGVEGADWAEQPDMIDDKLPKFLQDMLNRGGIHNGRGISIAFQRIIKITNRNKSVYAACDEKWEYKKKDVGGHSPNLIEWSAEKEFFLMNMQGQMDNMCKMVLEFFNVKSVEELSQRMASRIKLIGQ